VSVLVDWLSFSVPDSDVRADELLGLTDGSVTWVALPRGVSGYRQGKACGNIRVFWDGQPGMGTLFVLSGQGCRELESAWVTSSADSQASAALHVSGSGCDWLGYLGFLGAYGARITRCDFAMDDRAELVKLDEVVRCVESGELTTRWQEFTDTRKKLLRGSGERDGRTLYFGSFKSDALLRIYDKQAEQIQKGGEDPGPWVRVELQLRDERAQRAIAEMCGARSLAVLAGIIRGYVEFKRGEVGDSNKSRWLCVDWWETFLAGVGKVRLGSDPIIRTVAEAYQWVARQVAPTLALLVKHAEGDLGILNDLARAGLPRLQPRHMAMLAAGS